MSETISAPTLSYLIGLIYDAAINPKAWTTALEAMRTELNFTNSTLNIQLLPSGDVLLNETTNIPKDYLVRMADYGADVLEQWGGLATIMRMPLDQPYVLSQINPDAVRFDVTENRYSLEWVRPQGIIDAMAIPLARDDRALGSVAFGRHESAGFISTREIEIARLLVPHLQRAATINRLLDVAALARSTFAAAIDTLTVPVLLVSSELALIYANPPAQELLATADLAHMRDGRINFAGGGVSRAVMAAVKQAELDESAMGRKGLGIPVRIQNDPKAALHVLPLRRGRMSADKQAAAAIFIARVDDPFVAPIAIVSALFGLTPTEGRVFDQIVAGHTVSEVAKHLNVEIVTIKSHLQSIFSKTGVRRQLDLVKIAVSLAAPAL